MKVNTLIYSRHATLDRKDGAIRCYSCKGDDMVLDRQYTVTDPLYPLAAFEVQTLFRHLPAVSIKDRPTFVIDDKIADRLITHEGSLEPDDLRLAQLHKALEISCRHTELALSE